MSMLNEELIEQARQLNERSTQIISSTIDREKQKSLQKLKKSAVKAVFDATAFKYFNLKFLIAWMQNTYNFAYWKRQSTKHDSLWAYSDQAGFVMSSKLYLENGEFYNGSLNAGKRQGYGTLTEAPYSSGIQNVYMGDWQDDKRHGNGTLTSSDPLEEYVYDGEWHQGFKQGRGRLITKREKYSGLWLKDKYHQNGALVFSDLADKVGYVYEGDWNMGVKCGMGQYQDTTTGDIYIGEFKQDQFNGKVRSQRFNRLLQGQLKSVDQNSQMGDLYNGEFLKGKKHGQGQMISNSSTLTLETGEVVSFPFVYDGKW